MTEDRLSRLEDQVGELKNLVNELSGRLADLEGAPKTSRVVAAAPATTEEESVPSFNMAFTATRFMFLLGRAVLVLAGGFLLRALTEAGTIPPVAGFVLGSVYSLALVLMTHRFLGGSDFIGASSLGLTAALVAYPFLVESITKLHLVSPQTGGLTLVLITGVALWSAWQRRVRFLAWVFSLASLFAILGLGFSAGAPGFFAGLLLALGAVTILFAYTRHWHIKRWLVAAAANMVFLRLTIMATTPEGLGSGAAHISAPVMLTLDLALLVVYLGFFCYRALVQGKGVKVFDVVQSVFALAVGFGGASRIANATGRGDGALGLTALVAALAFYTIAFTVVRTRLGRGRGFFYFASLALIFLFLGSQVVAHGPWLSWSWMILGLGMAILGSRFDRMTLRAHSAIYLALASLHTGMLSSAVDAFAGSATSIWRPLNQAGGTNLGIVLICFFIFIMRGGHDQDPGPRRAPGALAAVLALLGLGTVVIGILTRALTGTPPDAASATVAVIRTAVLSLTTIFLALACRQPRVRELGWLVYPLLGLGCLKLLLEDLRQGNPLTLFIAFGFFGAALILAPRLLIASRRAAQIPSAATSPSKIS